METRLVEAACKPMLQQPPITASQADRAFKLSSSQHVQKIVQVHDEMQLEDLPADDPDSSSDVSASPSDVAASRSGVYRQGVSGKEPDGSACKPGVSAEEILKSEESEFHTKTSDSVSDEPEVDDGLEEDGYAEEGSEEDSSEEEGSEVQEGFEEEAAEESLEEPAPDKLASQAFISATEQVQPATPKVKAE